MNKTVSYPIKCPTVNVEYCGTITCEETHNEKIRYEMIVIIQECLDEEYSQEMCDEHLESAKMQGVSRAIRLLMTRRR